jgi:hypothetical protein
MEMMMKVGLDRVRRQVMSNDEANAVADELKRYRKIALQEQSLTQDERGPGNAPRTIEKHPSYGALNISRVSGGARLFDSKFRHQHFVKLSISGAQVSTHDNFRHVYPNDNWPLIEVEMSETQFARAITSLNMGSGTPCTIHTFFGEHVEEPPQSTSDAEDHKKRIKDTAERSVEGMKTIARRLEAFIAEKKRPTLKEMGELLHDAQCKLSNFSSNMAFVHQQLDEAMEERVDEAKAEIEAHVVSIVNKAGIEAIEEKKIQLRLGDS